jgi:phosphate starvation-inducible PhoH-like protein
MQPSMKKTSPELKSLSQYYKPKSYNQEQYVKYLSDYKTKVLFAVGPAGTGKTMFACNTAIQELKSGNINKIILTRPVVPVEEDIGFLPGNINKKMDPWTRPIFDIFLEFFSQKDIDLMVYNNIIEIAPLGYMRGRTFKKAFVIADEMQNSSPNQMLMLTTRIGDGSKMVITGDLKQSDKGHNSGLSDFINKYKLYERVVKSHQNAGKFYNPSIRIVELNNSDIERSPVVVNILDIYSTTEDDAKKAELDAKKVISVETQKEQQEEPQEELQKNEPTQIKNSNRGGFSAELFMSSPDFNDAALIPRSHMSKRFNN